MKALSAVALCSVRQRVAQPLKASAEQIPRKLQMTKRRLVLLLIESSSHGPVTTVSGCNRLRQRRRWKAIRFLRLDPHSGSLILGLLLLFRGRLMAGTGHIRPVHGGAVYIGSIDHRSSD